ncbi:hypothetical protein M0813_26845 [Anaeramoeba flamelloides]|uniref:BTB domain-containing protein n=1 Tax=Anaeramoeba flamelloides TaxID=1746091 RepID=A0ABQ8XYZ4_9EUKA|nr:hypothetical protein M0813_26845 [Anaeramoeba flamelloides]
MEQYYYFDRNTPTLEVLKDTDPTSKVVYKENLRDIRQIAGGENFNCYLQEESKFVVFSSKENKYNEYPNFITSTIIKISSGWSHVLLLDSEGKVYSISKTPKVDANGQPQNKQIEINKPYRIEFFEEKGLFVHDMTSGCISSYFLCSEKNSSNMESFALYACGNSSGTGTNTAVDIPKKVCDNVVKVFSGVYCYHFWFFTLDNKIMGAGENGSHKLGYRDSRSKLSVPKEILIPNIECSDIKDLKGGYNHSLLLTNNGELYGAGERDANGLSKEVQEFTKIDTFSGIFVNQVSISHHFNLALTDHGLYHWGTAYLKSNKQLASVIPRKMQISESINLENYTFCNSSFAFYLVPKTDSSLREDFTNLFQSGKFCDDKILGVPVHKLWVQVRIGKPIEHFQRWIKENTFDKEQIFDFLNWIYSNKKNNINSLHSKLFFNEYINDNELKKSTLKQSLTKLYSDEDSKNFFIKVLDPQDEDDDDNDDDDDNEQEFEEIPVHDFVLYARSGLYRELFNNLNEKQMTNKVQDYSKKTIETLELFIKYLYTEELALTADDDPELVVEELSDAMEYYQLNPKSQLSRALNQIKKQFDLN